MVFSYNMNTPASMSTFNYHPSPSLPSPPLHPDSSSLPPLSNFPLSLFPAIPPPPLKHHTIPSYPNPAHPRSLPPSSFISPSLSLSLLHLTSSQPEHPPPLRAACLLSSTFSLSLSLSLYLSLLSFICLPPSFCLFLSSTSLRPPEACRLARSSFIH